MLRLQRLPRATVPAMAAQRVKRLKDLVDMLERLPPSPDRDRVLSEVRSRAVDLDTGVTPRAMLPLREPTPPPPAPRIQRKPPAPVAEPARALVSTRPEPSFTLSDLLSLEESSLPHARADGDQAERPWTLGLRG
jgi:hypothetical protein